MTMTDFNELLLKQQEREKAAATAGYEAFMRSESESKKISNASNTGFGLYIKKHLLPLLVEEVRNKLKKRVFTNAADVNEALKLCTKSITDNNGKEKDKNFFNIEEATFIALQMTLDEPQYR
jgi:hypothetical protein